MQELGYGGIGPELGFTTNVINKYFDQYFPLAVRLGQWFETHSGKESHIYTTESWLVSLYLDCPLGMGLHCPSREQLAAFKQAVTAGYITWTASSINAHVEIMDMFLFQSTLHQSLYRDMQLDVPRKTVISQVCSRSDAILPKHLMYRVGLFAQTAPSPRRLLSQGQAPALSCAH